MTAQEFPPQVKGLLIIEDFDDIKAALRSPKVVAGMDRTPPYGIPDWIHGHILDLNGTPHAERRRIEAPVVGNAALEMLENGDVRPILGEYVDRWLASRGADGVVQVDLVNDVLSILLRVGAKVVGVDGVESDDQVATLLQHVDLGGKMFSSTFSRLSRDQQEELNEKGRISRKEFERDFLRPSVARRADLIRAAKDQGLPFDSLPRDIMTMLLGHFDQQGSMDDQIETLFSESIFFLNGATRTTMRTVCNTLLELLNWFERHPDDRARTGDFAFLHRAVEETLRLHSVLPLMYRRAAEDVELPSGRVIERGSRFVLLHGEANRSVDVFGDDAAIFNPERSVPDGTNRYGFGFGAGPHACFGRRVALGTDGATQGTVVTILSKLFELNVELAPNDPPVPVADTYYEEYLRLPVEFRVETQG
jgi:cytochrome P450